jgi:uncharacterized protein
MDIQFTSQGNQLIGTYYPSALDGAHPAALFVHGIPGFQKNHDIAQRLNELGWTALVIHLRGAWGSGGAYNIPGQVDDLIAAIDYLFTQNSQIKQLAVIGYSLGSRGAIVSAVRDTRVGAVVSLSGLHDFSEMMISDELIEMALPILSGVTGDDIRKQWSSLITNDNPIEVVSRLAPRPILIIHGSADEDVPSYGAPALAEAAGENATLLMLEDGDHGFSGLREKLVEAVTDWLENWRKG